MTLEKIINRLEFDKYAAYLKAQGLSDASIKRKLSSLLSFRKFLVKKGYLSTPSEDLVSLEPAVKEPSQNNTHSPLAFLPRPNKKFGLYLLIALLLITLSGLGFGLYSQTILKARKNLAYSTASSPVRPGRILSFQGRLTDSSQFKRNHPSKHLLCQIY